MANQNPNGNPTPDQGGQGDQQQNNDQVRDTVTGQPAQPQPQRDTVTGQPMPDQGGDQANGGEGNGAPAQ